jgi:dihydroorotate dehydrogenase/NAD-dependent dihydropyrimidine dehydrogenase PreA subunit
MSDLTTYIGTLKLKNPLILGAGPLSGTASHIRKCVDAEFGAVCAKTVTFSPFLQRYPRPLYRLKDYALRPDEPFYVPKDYMWLHREHNSIFPADQFVKIIKEVAPYCREHGTALIGSFAGRGLQEWQQIVTAYAEAGANAMELNFCCPFPPEGLVKDPSDAQLGIYFTQHPEQGAEVIRKLKESVGIPIFPKIGPGAGNFMQIAQIFKQAGADGISLFANDRLLRIDIETGRPVNYGPCAGTSPHMIAATMKWTSEIAQEVGLPVLAGRGVTQWEDIVEMLMSGAAGVEICAAAILHGLKYIRTLLAGLEAFLDRKRYATVDEIKGRALKHILNNRQLIEDTRALYSVVDLKKCIGCRRCQEVCVYDAIEALPKKNIITKEKCAGCTLCTQVCPVSAISTVELDDDNDHFRALAWEHKELMPALFPAIPGRKEQGK